MKFWKLIVPFTFAAGVAAGVGLKNVYDDFTAPAPLSIGDHFRAAVTDVYDADTWTLQRGDETHNARIWGIDAPERSQRCKQERRIVPCGMQARDAMRALVMDKTVDCEVKGFDDNRGRPVVQCTVGGKDPVAEIVRGGWAFSDTKYSDNPYGTEQNQAQLKRSGLWGMEFREPARWRACQALGRGGSGAVPADCIKPLGPLNR